MHPLARRVAPAQVLLQALVEVVGAVAVAEADHEPVVVGGEGEDRVALDHNAFHLTLADGSLQLAEVCVPAGQTRQRPRGKIGSLRWAWNRRVVSRTRLSGNERCKSRRMTLPRGFKKQNVTVRQR